MFSEADIRPDHLMPRAMELLEQDTRYLIARSGEFVRVPCPACGCVDTQAVMHKRGVTFDACDDCGTVYVNPRPTREILEDYYRQAKYYEYWNKYIYPQSEDVRRRKIFRPRAERVAEICERFAVSRRTIVDVGAAHGFFCEEIRALGAFERVVAIEPVAAMAESCRRRGFTVIEAPVERADLGSDPVDVIVSFEVLEHLFCPEAFLRGCEGLLSPDGLLVLSCPNIRGFDLLVLREAADSITPEHLNYFHPEALQTLCERCGFETVEITTPGKLDADIVRKKVMAGLYDLSERPFLQQVLIQEWDRVGEAFQRFLADNRLSSHMWFVGRKKRGPG